MKKNQIQSIIMHPCDDTDFNVLSDKINELHIEVIERKLNNADLNSKQKICIVDSIIKSLSLKELNGFIK